MLFAGTRPDGQSGLGFLWSTWAHLDQSSTRFTCVGRTYVATPLFGARYQTPGNLAGCLILYTNVYRTSSSGPPGVPFLQTSQDV